MIPFLFSKTKDALKTTKMMWRLSISQSNKRQGQPLMLPETPTKAKPRSYLKNQNHNQQNINIKKEK